MLIVSLLILIYVGYLSFALVYGKTISKLIPFLLFYLLIGIEGYISIIAPTLFYLKDIYLILLLITPMILNFANYKINRKTSIILLFLAAIIILYLFKSQNMFNGLKEARLYYLYPLLIFLPSLYKIELDGTTKHLIILLSILISIGIVDYFYPGGLIRQYYPYKQYWRSGFAISAIGTFGNRVNYALGAAILFFLSVEKYYETKKLVYVIPSAIGILGVMLSHSKTAFYVSVIELLLIIIISKDKKQKGILLVFLMVGFFIGYLSRFGLLEMLKQSNLTLSGRNYLWKERINMFLNNVFGVGLGVMGNYKIGAVDNTYLKMFVTFGIQSILILLPILIFIIVRINKSIYRAFGIRLLLFVTIIGFTIDIIHILALMVIFYVLTGIIIINQNGKSIEISKTDFKNWA